MVIQPDVLYKTVFSDVESFLEGLNPLEEAPPDISPRAFACHALLGSLLKKWNETSLVADRAAMTKFESFNKRSEIWSLSLETENDRQLYGSFRREIDDFLHPNGTELIPSYRSILEHAKCGPGATIGSDHLSSYAKLYDSKMATTSLDLYLMYRDYIDEYPTMREADCHRREKWGYPKIVNESLLSFVPKTRDISRIICVEPSLNMYFQQGVGAHLERRLFEAFGVSLAKQPDENRRMAYQASLDNGHATIDLSSASDSISLNLCKEIFPQWFFDILNTCRVPFAKFRDGRCKLHMMSTMGNGFTFPLQTALFSCLIRACYRERGIPLWVAGKRNWACFGDDLIVDNRCYRDVINLLGILGFCPNASKTFNEGPFRESCGTDWFNGQPVRGVYIKQLRTPQDILVAINLLNEWSATTGVMLQGSVALLLSGLKRGELLLVPFDASIDAGLRVPFQVLKKRKYDRNGSIVYRSYQSRSDVYLFDEDGGITYPRRRKQNLTYNASGLMMSFLRGEVVSSKISTRSSRVSYKTKWVHTPFWDYVPTYRATDVRFAGWQWWETTVLINLSNSL